MFLESDDRKEYFFNESIFHELHFISFGYEKCLPKHSFGPQIREYFILHYILSGKGVFENRDKIYHLHEGNCFLIKPSDLFAIYQADSISPSEYVWIGFAGTKAHEIMDQLGFSSANRVGLVRNQEALCHYLQPFINGKFLTNANPLMIQGELLQLLSHFDLNIDQKPSQINKNNQQKYVDLFVKYIQNHYTQPDLTIDEIANSIGLHPTYLTQIVKDELKQTSVSYLINYRVLKARHLLENTDSTVEAVAESVGYRNVLSFSRAFKNFFGYSPKNYMKVMQKKLGGKE